MNRETSSTTGSTDPPKIGQRPGSIEVSVPTSQNVRILKAELANAFPDSLCPNRDQISPQGLDDAHKPWNREMKEPLNHVVLNFQSWEMDEFEEFDDSWTGKAINVRESVRLYFNDPIAHNVLTALTLERNDTLLSLSTVRNEIINIASRRRPGLFDDFRNEGAIAEALQKFMAGAGTRVTPAFLALGLIVRRDFMGMGEEVDVEEVERMLAFAEGLVVLSGIVGEG